MPSFCCAAYQENDFSLRTCPFLSEDLGAFRASWSESSLELGRGRHKTLAHRHYVLVDLPAILILGPGDIEAPKNSCDDHIL